MVEKTATPGRVVLADLEATATVAARLAAALRAGDVVCLSGALGSGKTTFARFILRALGVREDVPSPTFNLVLTYETAAGLVWHCDLYRISGEDDLVELGLEDAFADGIVMIEWPDRLGRAMPLERLELSFAAHDDDRRLLTWRAVGATAARLAAAIEGTPS